MADRAKWSQQVERKGRYPPHRPFFRVSEFRFAAMAGAAFFDLDRTLLRGASGPLITEALIQAGLVNERTLGAQQAIYRVFDFVGETLPSIGLARAAALAAKGWPLDAMRAAGKAAAEKPRRRRRAVRPSDHRGAPRRRPPARARHHDALRTDPSARRPARLRRRRRDAVRPRRRRAHRRARGRLRVVAGQARRGARRGRPSTASTSPRATRTPTRSTTRRCCQPSGIRTR